MSYLEILCKKAILCQESIALDEAITSPEIKKEEKAENIFAPSTVISLPIFPRSIAVNAKPREESVDIVQSEIYDSTANPEYNFSTKFDYIHIHSLINDLLLTENTNCRICLKSAEYQKKGKDKAKGEDKLFGTVNLKWKEWIFSAINSKDPAKWTFSSPIIDPENNALKRGELDFEINFYTKAKPKEVTDKENPNQADDAKESECWQKCENFINLIPAKYSYLVINGKNIKSIPTDWYSKSEDDAQNSISICFEVHCSKGYAEKIQMDLPLLVDEERENEQTLSLDKEWMFFVDEYGLNYYLNRAQNKESFDIQVNFMYFCSPYLLCSCLIISLITSLHVKIRKRRSLKRWNINSVFHWGFGHLLVPEPVHCHKQNMRSIGWQKTKIQSAQAVSS